MAGDIKGKYGGGSSTTLTVTNLHSLASAQDWAAGWSSASVDNTSNLYLDWMIGGSFTTHASNRQAGSINVYVIGAFNLTPTWPASATGTWGTEGAASFVDTEERDGAAILIQSITVDNSASAVYPMKSRWLASAFGGQLPPYFAVFVAQNASTTTTAGLASSGSALYLTPWLAQYT